MDGSVTAAIITGSCTVTATVSGIVMTHVMNGHFEPMSNDRRNAITGTWQGSGQQQGITPEDPILESVICTFVAKGKLVTGEGSIRFSIPGKEIVQTFIIKGGFVHDRFLKAEYKNKNGSAMQFGHVILELDALALTLTGSYQGYGAVTQRLVSGTLVMQRSSTVV